MLVVLCVVNPVWWCNACRWPSGVCFTCRARLSLASGLLHMPCLYGTAGRSCVLLWQGWPAVLWQAPRWNTETAMFCVWWGITALSSKTKHTNTQPFCRWTCSLILVLRWSLTCASSLDRLIFRAFFDTIPQSFLRHLLYLVTVLVQKQDSSVIESNMYWRANNCCSYFVWFELI